MGYLDPDRRQVMLDAGAALIAEASLAELLGFLTAERIAAHAELGAGSALLPRTIRRTLAIDYLKRSDIDLSFPQKLVQGLALRAAEYWSAYPTNHHELSLAAVLRTAIVPPIDEPKRTAVDRLMALAFAAADTDRDARAMLFFTTSANDVVRSVLMPAWFKQQGEPASRLMFESLDDLDEALAVLRAGRVLARSLNLTPGQIDRAVNFVLCCWSTTPLGHMAVARGGTATVARCALSAVLRRAK